jgi:hypothetical protein
VEFGYTCILARITLLVLQHIVQEVCLALSFSWDLNFSEKTVDLRLKIVAFKYNFAFNFVQLNLAKDYFYFDHSCSRT